MYRECAAENCALVLTTTARAGRKLQDDSRNCTDEARRLVPPPFQEITMNRLMITTALILATFVVIGCSSDDDPNTDCGAQNDGLSCERASGSCTAQICVEGNWECPEGSHETALTADSCQAAAGASGAAGASSTAGASGAVSVAGGAAGSAGIGA